MADVVREGFLIGGWVAMWRPLEVFLYDWWPVRAEIRLFARLSAMPVRINYRGVGTSQAWERTGRRYRLKPRDRVGRTSPLDPMPEGA